MDKHECEGSKLEEVCIFNDEKDWLIKLQQPSYQTTEFIENIKFCPWCGEKLEAP